MQKRALRLTEISDPSFVDRRRTDGPGVRQVHLLRAGGIVVAEAWQQIGRGGLKPGERVIINGLQQVRPGLTVEPKLVDMPTSKGLKANETVSLTKVAPSP